MRIIAGEFRSRRLKSVPGMDTRPTPDRLRESLFSILSPEIEGKVFVDAYAGTGSVGLEAISRGAARALFIERSRPAAQVLNENIRMLGVGARAQVLHGKALRFLEGIRADIVFLDPPYEPFKVYGEALAVLAETAVPLVIAQHASRAKLPETAGPLQTVRVVRQGDNSLTFYRRAGDEQERESSALQDAHGDDGLVVSDGAFAPEAVEIGKNCGGDPLRALRAVSLYNTQQPL